LIWQTWIMLCGGMFGLPIYRWSASDEVFQEVNQWWRTNQEAKRILSEKDGIWLSGNTICVESSQEGRELQRMVRQALGQSSSKRGLVFDEEEMFFRFRHLGERQYDDALRGVSQEREADNLVSQRSDGDYSYETALPIVFCRRTNVELERQTLSIMKACEVVGVSRRTIYNWMAGGKIEYVRTAGGSVRIFADSLWRSPEAGQPQQEIQH